MMKKVEDNNQSENKVLPLVQNEISFISLFAGGGGSSLGYQWAGLKELLAIEFDPHAVSTLNNNFPELNVQSWNIMKLNGWEILEAIGMEPGQLDVLDASPPCQDFSNSNTKRDANGEKNTLYFKTLDLITVIKPKVFVIENVEGMKQGKMIPVWNKIMDRVSEMPYTVKFKVIKAENYGVHQERRRVILVGVREDIASNFDIQNFFPAPTTLDQDMSVKSLLPKVLGFSPGQFEDRFIPSTRPVCTITKTASMWFYDIDGTRRRPTIDEMKKLSSFPESYVLEGGYTSQFARIGNAVPPKVTEAIGKHIREVILTREVLRWCSDNGFESGGILCAA